MKEQCPYKLRTDLPKLPARMESLRIDKRGYPVPFFVTWLKDMPEFRLADERAFNACLQEGKCWVCGKTLTMPVVFVIGPMCAVNRTTGEPPCHIECAEFSVKACPFLVNPNMVRRQEEEIKAIGKDVPGKMISRNPGVTCLWHTRQLNPFQVDLKGGILIEVGPPELVTWWTEGRMALRGEVEQAIRTGEPLLRQACDQEHTPDWRTHAHAELDVKIRELKKLLPRTI